MNNTGFIVVAGGSGTRMGYEIPKQFIELQGVPILIHTLNHIQKIYDFPICLVLPQDQIDFWNEIVEKYNFKNDKLILAIGGKTRTQSVKNGLIKMKENHSDLKWIAIHDGVRPFLNAEIVSKCLQQAQNQGAAICAVQTKNSIRIAPNNSSSFNFNRDWIYEVQTPQIFNFNEIYKCYESLENQEFSDDAAVWEYFGKSIYISIGSYFNIKITTPEDLIIAENILNNFRI